MVNFEDTVKARLNPNNYSYYREKGYIDVKTGELFDVKIKDLTKGTKTQIPITCDFCGEIYYKSYNAFNNKNYNHKYDACDKCKIKKAKLTLKETTMDNKWNNLVRVCNDNGYKVITPKSEVTNVKMKIKYLCDKHGEQESDYMNMISGHFCYLCGREQTVNKSRKNINDVITDIEKYNGNKLLNPEDYKNSHESNLRILCGTCGKNVFIMSRHAYRAKTASHLCAECSKKISGGELRIKNVLDDNGVSYEREKRFSDCRDYFPLPFDFYLPEHNICIEFDGEQHYNSNFYVTMKSKNPEELFEKEQLHDEIKTKYCEEKGIKLIRIPYSKLNQIEKIVLDIFK